MSGIVSGWFLVTEHEDGPTALQTTTGGYPHVTVVYYPRTRTFVDSKEIIELANAQFYQLFAREPNTFYVDRIKINTFEKGNGDMRHDVLFLLDEQSAERVERLRESLQNRLPEIPFVTREPHITDSIHTTLASARARVTELNKRKFVPFAFRYTGQTFD